MGDPHNPDRYGETWAQYRIDAYLEVLRRLKPHAVFSGGWAWHFMSPAGHIEYKHAHDHKDVDLMVPPRTVSTVLGILLGDGFEKVRTRYDRLPSDEDFRRYEKVVEVEGQQPFRLTIDFFVKEVPVLQTDGGWLVVRPDVLLTYYSTIHSSKSCWAVQAASRLLEAGELVENFRHNGNLMACPDLDCYFCSKCGWSGQFPERQQALVLCGGCKKYVVHNTGKPTFKTKAVVMREAARMMENFGR